MVKHIFIYPNGDGVFMATIDGVTEYKTGKWCFCELNGKECPKAIPCHFFKASIESFENDEDAYVYIVEHFDVKCETDGETVFKNLVDEKGLPYPFRSEW